MKIISVPINNVKPYWRSPRSSGKAVDAVKASIERYGFNSPIVVDENYVIVAGHTRLRAARQLGMEEVPVIVARLDPIAAKEYRIADNAAGGIATWNYEALAKELAAMPDYETMRPFFKEGELAAILGDDSFQQSMEASVEVLPDPIVSDEPSVALDCPHCLHSFSMEVSDL